MRTNFNQKKLTMQSLNNCPICGGAWLNDHIQNGFMIPHHCSKCAMDYYPISKFLIKRDILGCKDYHLTWDLILNTCEYGSISMGKFIDDRLKLPWLSFDITPEKLKLYLVFS
jgi:ribosomal protein L32